MVRDLIPIASFALWLIPPIVLAAEPNADAGIMEVRGAEEPTTDAAVYGEGVRPTPWRSPARELAGFHLPPGFEVRLFASEPQIAKPLNMAFDDRGRMWVTSSVEYPYPAKDRQSARDTIKILDDIDGDGSADQVTTFADGLNIPIGVLPYGQGCLCFSIPNIWYLVDTDGDGRCDRRQVVLGPFDTTRDTHGMINSLRDGGDGWIYACHGFNNQSEVAGSDGHLVKLHSGNTFRFRPDGSRVEHYTYGQVNPFGMTEDDWGYRYTADCHSKPITQLIQGACYPSFGKPHDGLGFLPPTVDHLHGSTAISGIQYITSRSSIVPLRGQVISGNVMTSRLNRNRLTYQGATAVGQELADFLTSDDPWFRPVDIRLGPAEHLYVADFYNKIIGHYEVPLDHPERDRTSGRIWQIRYTGPSPAAAESARDACQPMRQVEGPIDEQKFAAMVGDRCPQRRVKALLLAAADPAHLTVTRLEAARSALEDNNPHVVRAAAELLGQGGGSDDVWRIVQHLPAVSRRDHVLRQTIRIAIRNLLVNATESDTVWSKPLNAELASILLAIPRPVAANAVLEYLATHGGVVDDRDKLIAHAAQNAGKDALVRCVQLARQIAGDNREQQFSLLDVLCSSQNARPGSVPMPLREWALDLVAGELSRVQASDQLVGWTTRDGGIWPRETRKLRGDGQANLVSSFGRGERYVGSLVSDRFPAPQEITFWLAGHNGFPDQQDHGKNRIRLILAETDEVLFEAMPPRNDQAVRVSWDSGQMTGRDVRMVCTDGDSAGAYAWIAFGKFDPHWLQPSGGAAALETSLRWIKRLGLEEQLASLESMLSDEHGSGQLSPRLRIAVAGTIASLHGDHGAAVGLEYLQSTHPPPALVQPAIDAACRSDRQAIMESIKSLCKRLSSSQQREFAIDWAKSGADASALIQMTDRGWISPSVLADATVLQAITPRLSAQQTKQLKSLTKDIDAVAEQSALLRQLQDSLADHVANRGNGQRLYAKHCASCHQLRGEGTVVGPQLDGAATRSRERLLEDVVTPDRNIDQAFRTTSFLTEQGRVVVGLVVSETDREVTVIQSDGKQTTIDLASVELRRQGGRSLMPGNMGEVLSSAELGDLISFIRDKE